MPDKRTTEALIADARRGNRAAFDELARGVHEELHAFAISRLSPALRERLEPDDVVQDALLKAFENVERFHWQGPQSLKRWLFAIAEHVIRNASRKRSLPTSDYLIGTESDEPSPSRAMRRDERLERLRRSLQSLSPDHREVVELARIEGLKVKDIAERMGRSPGAVKQLLSRALENLKDGFGDTESLGLPDRPLESRGRNDG